MSQPDYTVQLDAFHGPLDLLMHLIKRAEVDIIDIPIAAITDQYIAHLKGLDRIDIETAGEFLVMAAMLMEIKSRMLMPPAERSAASDAAGEAEAISGLDASDPRYELVKQLLAYKKFRDAAENLAERREEWLQRSPLARIALAKPQAAEDPPDHEPPPTDLEDIGVWDLFEVFQRITEAVDFGRLGDHKVEYDDTPIVLHEADLLDQLSRAAGGRLSLRAACAGRTRGEMIGLFLATLELVRQHKVRVIQDRVHDDILLEHREEIEAPVAAPGPGLRSDV
ncbi:MAG: segregation/condensation protein A [Phycisphaerales bacterium]|nr:segregation/condensation protein A [Phycisphaerales bacterium]